MVQARTATPEWLSMVEGLISPPFLPSPPIEALWPLFIQGQLGYNTYFYLISEKTFKDKEGNTKENKLYIEGGYAGLLEKEMRDMIDPNFVVGQFTGIFEGIGEWFVGIYDLVTGIGSFLWDGIKNIGNLISGQPSPWMETLKNGAMSAGEWLKANGKKLWEFVASLIKDPKQPLKEIGANIKTALITAGKTMAFNAGMDMAKNSVKDMQRPAYAKGNAIGRFVGNLIPDILLAVFSGAIGNVVKGALEFFKGLQIVARVGELLSKFMKALRGAMGAIEKVWNTIFKFATGSFSKLGEELGKVKKFFEDVLQWGDEGKLSKNLVEDASSLNKEKNASKIEDLTKKDSKVEDLNQEKEIQKNKKEENKKKKENGKKKDNKELEKQEALLLAEGILKVSNESDGSVIGLESALYTVDAKYTVVERFELEPVATGWDVYMIASKTKVGTKKKSKKLWQLTEEKASKVANHKHWGKFYKSLPDSQGKTTWWSKDIYGHGKSNFKVFEESKGGLEWIYDADEYGNYIFDKHKGPTGLFIEWSQLNIIK